MANKKATIDGVYEALTELAGAVGSGFEKVDKRFDEIEHRLERIEAIILRDHEHRIEKLEQRMGAR